MHVPPSAARVPLHTADEVNERIARQTEQSVAFYREHPELIDERLTALDEEWDVERLLEVNAATLALTGTLLGAFVDRRWLALPIAVTAFLCQHGVQGWCPPLPVLRRMGVRTAREIEAERYALKAMRGDFADVDDDADAALRATGRLRSWLRSRPRVAPVGGPGGSESSASSDKGSSESGSDQGERERS